MRDVASAEISPPICVRAWSGSFAATRQADHAARRRQRLRGANMSRLTGIGGRIPSSVTSRESAPGILMIDGGSRECGERVLRRVDFTGFEQLKLHEFAVGEHDAGAVNEATVTRLAETTLRIWGKGMKPEIP